MTAATITSLPRIRSELGWAPRIAIADGLAGTYEAMADGFRAAA